MLTAFAEKPLTGLIFSALAVGITSYFGQAAIFDPLILIAFICIALVFRRNIDLLSICCILIAERALEELMWRLLDYTIWFKIPGYILCIALTLLVTNGFLRYYCLAFFSLAAASEMYWYATAYPAPKIIWFCYTLLILIVIRKCLRMRVFWLIELNPKLTPTPLYLDSKLLLANAAFMVTTSLLVFEYYLRHLVQLQDILYVYHAYPFANHIISIFILYMLIVESISHLKNIELQA